MAILGDQLIQRRLREDPTHLLQLVDCPQKKCAAVPSGRALPERLQMTILKAPLAFAGAGVHYRSSFRFLITPRQ